MDFEDVSPFLLGRDLARIMTRDHVPHVDEFLREVTPERLVAHEPPSWASADDGERALESFRRGLD